MPDERVWRAMDIDGVTVEVTYDQGTWYARLTPGDFWVGSGGTLVEALDKKLPNRLGDAE